MFLYLSGWRVGEMCGLEWADVDQARGIIRRLAKRSKNAEPRTLPILGELAEVLERQQALLAARLGRETNQRVLRRLGPGMQTRRLPGSRRARSAADGGT
jgi:integrase